MPGNVCVCKWECSVELMLYCSLSYRNKLESEHGGTGHFSLRVGAALQVQAGVQAEREEFTFGAAKCTKILI